MTGINTRLRSSSEPAASSAKRGTPSSTQAAAGKRDDAPDLPPFCQPDLDDLFLGDPDDAASKPELLEQEASAQAKLTQPATTPVPSSKEAVCEKIVAAGKCMDEALKVGVDMARSTFLRKAVGAVLSVISVGVMVAATLATGGAAAPALAAACLATVSYAADAACAWREWKNAQALAAGQPEPYDPLPCGTSALANLVHAGMCALGAEDETAKTWAHRAEHVVAVGLLVFSLATCAVPPELKLVEAAIKFASVGLKSCMYAYATLASAQARDDAHAVHAIHATHTAHKAHPADAAGGMSLEQQMERALELLTGKPGDDPLGREKYFNELLAQTEDGSDARRALERLMEDGKFSHDKATRLHTAMERAIEGLEPTALNFLSFGAHIASLVLVGRELPLGAE